ncbi:transcription factor Atoh8-like [Acipenser ruthenus]|uniref:transcription factor Atoh8-like n=1 Tax=Acipenser ruthenus TaxID=7906 RepID=UPI00145B6D8F|nr:transcription factor Atoh8-like [Acipenser ruthenus]
MKDPQIISEGDWKALCAKEIHGIRKMKRKSRDALKHSNGVKSFRQDPKMDEDLLSGLTETTGQNLHHETVQKRAFAAPSNGMDNIIDLRRNPSTFIDMRTTSLPALTGQMDAAAAAVAASVSAVSPTKEEFSRSVQVTEFEHQHSLQSRIVLCQRPPESPYSSVSQESYINNNSDPTASPRKRLGETTGVATEIKAIQQTRRLLANARERTRVHTISAAFEALRKQVPCYSYGQKLSKLAILRIACNYILSLAQLADLDYTSDHSNTSFSECVEQCTRTLQAEGRSKKRKE